MVKVKEENGKTGPGRLNILRAHSLVSSAINSSQLGFGT